MPAHRATAQVAACIAERAVVDVLPVGDRCCELVGVLGALSLPRLFPLGAVGAAPRLAASAARWRLVVVLVFATSSGVAYARARAR
ncbi:MAG: hypothetical protein ACRDQA_23775 [Nocardioidaceae bacterium]